TTERWIIRNLAVAPSDNHPIHIHGVDQQLVSRNGSPPAPYELMKETWLVAPSETIELLLKFTDHVGRFVIHCHMLEHEDDGMMAQFEVVTPTPTPTATPTSTATPTYTTTPTDTPTATSTPMPTATPTPAAPPGPCAPRPTVGVSAVRAAPGRLQVTI